MPYAKKYRTKKRPMRKRVYKRAPYRRKGIGKIARGISQSVIPFKRTTSQIIDTDQLSNLPSNYSMSSSSVTGYHALLGTQVFQFSQLPEYANLSAVYKFYKINCVVIKLYPCYSQSIPNGATSTNNSQSYQGQNIICTYTQNLTGTGLSATIDNNFWMTQQARKQKIITGTKPITFKVYPKLQNEVYSSLTNTDYTIMRPKFISTQEPSTPHFGLDLAFTFTDSSDAIRTDFAADYTTPIKFRMDMTYYLQLKGTH